MTLTPALSEINLQAMLLNSVSTSHVDSPARPHLAAKDNLNSLLADNQVIDKANPAATTVWHFPSSLAKGK